MEIKINFISTSRPAAAADDISQFSCGLFFNRIDISDIFRSHNVTLPGKVVNPLVCNQQSPITKKKIYQQFERATGPHIPIFFHNFFQV